MAGRCSESTNHRRARSRYLALAAVHKTPKDGVKVLAAPKYPACDFGDSMQPGSGSSGFRKCRRYIYTEIGLVPDIVENRGLIVYREHNTEQGDPKCIQVIAREKGCHNLWQLF